MKITLDHNLLIDLETTQAANDELQQLVAFHDSGQITIRVVGIGASERLKDKTYALTFSTFQDRVRRLSQREFEILKPLGYWNITYWDWCIWGGEGTPESELERKIHTVLFPEIEFKWQDFARANGVDHDQAVQSQSREWQKWRNRKCDVLAMWCHIYYAGDAFITTDDHFHQATKKPALISLGAKSILYPTEVVSMIAGPE